MQAERSDVLIMGGGLAGLTLAIQLRRELPALTVRVLERNRHPVPEAAFKIGESTVEIGAHYLDSVLDLRAHLEARQLRKFGFRFFFNESSESLDDRVELGVSRVFPTPTWQLDRGILENFLAEHAVALGVEFLDGASVRNFEIATDGNDHIAHYTRDGSEQVMRARWLIDASGSQALIKRKLGLEEANAHDANAIWFRIGARIGIDDWHGGEWARRCDPPERWRSTNHLCGPGYWAWLIPLSSGSHSVGIVADNALHPLETINSFDKALAWFARHQPQLHHVLEAQREQLQDFAFQRHFSHGCKQVFSAQRWAITGIAGVFLDPFYSPGTDYIAFANTYIVDLIARDARGESFSRQARQYENLYFSFYRNMLTLYEGQYAMFGHAQWMPLKVLWDYAWYWGVLCQFFFQQRLTDLSLFARLAAPLARCAELNREMQLLLRRVAGADAGSARVEFLDQCDMPWFAELNRGLRDRLDAEGFQQRIEDHALLLERLAAQIARQARIQRADALHDLPVLATLDIDAEADLLRAA